MMWRGTSSSSGPSQDGQLVKFFSLLAWTSKGGGQSSGKAILACINQPHPFSRDNTILFGLLPCQTDNYSALAAMAELYASDVDNLRTNGIMVSGVTRPVHLTLRGDHSFTTSFDCHAGASCRFPCGYCCALARPSAKTIKLIPKYADYGTIQEGSRAARIPRTLSQKTAVAALYADGPLTTLSDPHAVTMTLSTERRLLILVAPEDIVPMSLHITLGVSALLLTVGVEAVVFDAGAARALEYALEPTATLRPYVGVSPAPYWGGTFQGRACHKIGRRLAAVCDVLNRYLPSARAAAYRRACELWACSPS